MTAATQEPQAPARSSAELLEELKTLTAKQMRVGKESEEASERARDADDRLKEARDAVTSKRKAFEEAVAREAYEEASRRKGGRTS